MTSKKTSNQSRITVRSAKKEVTASKAKEIPEKMTQSPILKTKIQTGTGWKRSVAQRKQGTKKRSSSA